MTSRGSELVGIGNLPWYKEMLMSTVGSIMELSENDIWGEC